MIITKTPMRISLGGGGTDLPFYYSKKGCSLVTAAINKSVYVSAKEMFENNIRLSYSKIEITDDVDKIKNSRAREALKLCNVNRGVEIVTMADLPTRSGLGGSASFLVGLLHSLHLMKGEIPSKKKLAEEACKIEMDILNYPVGKQDQYAAAYGGIVNLKINKEGSVSVEQVNVSEDTVKELQNNLMLFYTGISRDASKILEIQKNNFNSDKNKIKHMNEIKKNGIDIQKYLEKGNLDKLGRLFNVHWENKKNMANEITNQKIDSWYDLAMENGAFGGKIVGAGGGGFLLFYVKNEKKHFVKTMIESKLEYVPFEFDWEGTKVLVRS